MIRLISAVAILVLIGCSAVPSLPTHVQIQSAAIKQSGGPFSASYSGTYTFTSCGKFAFSGFGSGSFIHNSTESGSMLANRFCTWSGTATLVNKFNPQNSITMFLGLFPYKHNTPCDPKGAPLDFTVTGGTGKFAHAMGSGKVVFTCNSNNTYTDQWSGSLTF